MINVIKENNEGMQRAELHRKIWSIADNVRGAVDGWDFKQYILGILFYRFISENMTEFFNSAEHEAGDLEFDYSQISDEEAEMDFRPNTVEDKGFFILPSQLFENVVKTASVNENLNTELANIFKSIEGSAIAYEKFNKETMFKEEIQKKLQTLRNEITQLEEKKKNIVIAKNWINEGLSYIFFTKDRLELGYKNSKYFLKTQGNHVKPNKISVGERNAMGLCYFFTEVMRNKEAKYIYTCEYLLIIDDPVSSFDFENRIGILSFLRYQLSRFLNENENTKILIFTHDLQSLFDLKNMIDDIGEGSNVCKELVDNKVKNMNFKKTNEYTYLINEIFKYAKQPSDEKDPVIGNIMRKALEAYGTFNYKIGIDRITLDQNLMQDSHDNLKKYFENLLYRLVLHGESHMEEKAQNTMNRNFFNYISQQEKQNTAKGIIVLLYSIDKWHVLAHLQGIDNADQIIEGWRDHIINLSYI